jgi:hypothetical protein
VRGNIDKPRYVFFKVSEALYFRGLLVLFGPKTKKSSPFISFMRFKPRAFLLPARCKIGFPVLTAHLRRHGARRCLKARRRGDLFPDGELLPPILSALSPSRPSNLEPPRLTPSPLYQRELLARHLAAAAATAWTGPSRLPELGENKKNLREMFDAFRMDYWKEACARVLLIR